MAEDPRQFSLPAFNLWVGIWRWATSLDDDPDVMALAQLRYGWNGSVTWSTLTSDKAVGTQTMSGTTVPKLLLLERATDIRPPYSSGNLNSERDVVEVPLGSGRFYAVVDVEQAHAGFPNEYRCAVIIKCAKDRWPVPEPPIYDPPA